LPKKSNFDKELENCLPDGWIKERQKPLEFFRPAIDKPDYYFDGMFNWTGEEKKKTAVLIRKVT
jgi:putative DNA primase/helicase